MSRNKKYDVFCFSQYVHDFCILLFHEISEKVGYNNTPERPRRYRRQSSLFFVANVEVAVAVIGDKILSPVAAVAVIGDNILSPVACRRLKICPFF